MRQNIDKRIRSQPPNISMKNKFPAGRSTIVLLPGAENSIPLPAWKLVSIRKIDFATLDR